MSARAAFGRRKRSAHPILAALFAVLVVAALMLAACGVPNVTGTPATPTGVIDLNDWYLTLPIRDPSGRDGKGPWDVHQPQLSSFSDPDYFHTGSDRFGHYLEFRVPASDRSAARPGDVVTTTSKASGAARTELRQTTNGELAAWSLDGEDVYELTVTLTCDATSISDRQEVIVGQIHGPGSKPPVILSMDHSRGGALEFYKQGPRFGDLLTGVQPGELFTYRITGGRGRLEIAAARGDASQLPARAQVDLPSSAVEERENLYFKSGAYVKTKLTARASGVAVVHQYENKLVVR